MNSRADLRIVGMTHAVRILILLLAIPPILQSVGHVSLQSGTQDLAQWLWLPSLGETGYCASRC
ncbi:hypothetical protein A8U91_02067 [Halomonas elongata]|uniref:Uncharacterized protein n=2 Tax=Halomonas elongata TaxID=2746 RepID=A0A1B8P643_HALEL|nr:hypothetical protein A8U91_02067 [Halomonas elongata]